ncbi:PAS domain-containing sensor histidine kinase [Flaviaesturariibacter flavus]|uniref:histidine kinase n=1 Tax=Flaviaesturariibacter flavus TaxID=2502780 RepID=A0A4R1BPH3_9BACT|nr:PAS domain-containing sensor histidine kinase [Flaviaesturariibacter flavus]TCJ19115.1 PAS domain-containing sensor histidine kinase [Flaviaesturariibacter flavus]
MQASGQSIYEAYPGMYGFRHLHGLAALILDGRLSEFARHQYQRSVQLNLPLLRHLSKYGPGELLALTEKSSGDFLGALAAGKIFEFLNASVMRWVANELSIVDYSDVIVEDITLLNFIRAEGLRQFIPDFTSDLRTAVETAGEIDRLFMGYNTSSMITFIDLLRARISRREDQLLEAEALARLGSFDWDIVNEVSDSSPELRKILGNDAQMPLAEFIERVHADDSGLLRNAIAEAFVSGSLQCEFRFLRPDGSQRTVWARGVVHSGPNGPERMVGVIQDVSERKRMEETLLLKTLELEHSNEELQQFASVASHDLKEPLRKIVLYTGLLESARAGEWSEEARRHLERIMDAARRMRLLIEDILAFSSLNQQQEPQLVSLERILDEVREVLESRIRETGAMISSDGLPEATVVPFQFRQLFQNLLSNSLKFARPGVPPVISISHQHIEVPMPGRAAGVLPALQLLFSDNGIGFPAHYSEKIFGLFNRLHSHKDYEGTGLGLAICRKVVENHGGRIEASSGPGQGATFRIVLPQ